MNIISQFNRLLEKNFSLYLKKYFTDNSYLFKSSDFSNYCDFINDLDSFSTSFITELLKSYFEYIDECFFHSYYRKNFCSSKGFYERKNYVTLFGEITFKRRYYFDKTTKEYFFFTDLFLGLPKYKHFDPFVCAEFVDNSSQYSYSKTGKIIADKIGNRTSSNIDISRATVRNIVLGFNPIINEQSELKRIERLFIMLDEKFVGSQFNKGKDHMIKAAVIFEGTELEYKTKKKENSMDRYRLINEHVCANINNELVLDAVNYIYNHYDTDYLKEIYFMGDCAKWIKNFPKSHWFKFNKDIINSFSMDGFHFSQALNQITTTKCNFEIHDALCDLVMNNDKELFKDTCLKFMVKNKERTKTIINKMEYILNNWDERQLYQNKPYLKCSMESHISHIFADLFTARPKAYSKKGLEKLLQIRLLKVNGYNLKELYFNYISKTNNEEEFNQFIKNRAKLNLEFSPKNKYDIEYHLTAHSSKQLQFQN